jgi:hypothetical protein
MPDGMFNFIANWIRYAARVQCYAALVSDRFPPFSGSEPYSVDCTIEKPERLSRLTTFFRLVMSIPAFIVLFAVSIVAALVMAVLWFAIVFTGKAPRGMHDFLCKTQRYSIRVTAYMLYVTDRYPNFEDAGGSGAREPGGAAAAW